MIMVKQQIMTRMIGMYNLQRIVAKTKLPFLVQDTQMNLDNRESQITMCFQEET